MVLSKEFETQYYISSHLHTTDAIPVSIKKVHHIMKRVLLTQARDSLQITLLDLETKHAKSKETDILSVTCKNIYL